MIQALKQDWKGSFSSELEGFFFGHVTTVILPLSCGATPCSRLCRLLYPREIAPTAFQRVRLASAVHCGAHLQQNSQWRFPASAGSRSGLQLKLCQKDISLGTFSILKHLKKEVFDLKKENASEVRADSAASLGFPAPKRPA